MKPRKAKQFPVVIKHGLLQKCHLLMRFPAINLHIFPMIFPMDFLRDFPAFFDPMA
jgi:hypothetical protein